MRTYPAALTAEMQEVFSHSTWLVRMITRSVAGNGYTPTTVRASTTEAVTWDSQTWSTIGLQVEGQVSEDQMTFSMPNESGQVLSFASTGELHRATVDVFVMYPNASEAVQWMQGYVSTVSGLFRDRATLRVERYVDANSVVPTTFIAPPGWTKLPPVDLVIEWAGKRIELDN